MKHIKKMSTGLAITAALSMMGACETTKTPRGVVASAGAAIERDDYQAWQSLFVAGEQSCLASQNSYLSFRQLYLERGTKGISLRERLLAEERPNQDIYRRLYAVDIYDYHAHRVLLTPLVVCDYYANFLTRDSYPNCTAWDHLSHNCLGGVIPSSLVRSECRIQGLE